MTKSTEIIARAIQTVGGMDNIERSWSTALPEEEAAIDALHEAGYAIEQDWAPIDTAPTDGTWIVLFVPSHGPVRARWMLFGQPASGRWYSYERGKTIIKATHWRPMVKSPSRVAIAKKQNDGS